MKNKLFLLTSVLLIQLFFSGFVAAEMIVATKHEAGRKVYNYRCYYCHGYSGDAQTLAAKWLFPKPANFAAMSAESRTREQMEHVVKNGIAGTAMMSFNYFLTNSDVTDVVNFVRNEFMTAKAKNTKYHTAEAGWPNHDKYDIAFPFATGEIAVDVNDETLTDNQRAGKILYLSACITCHDQGRVETEGPIWRSESISYPRNNYSFSNFDGISGASVFLKHDRLDKNVKLSSSAQIGKRLWDQNCAFCHAKDGTGHNWIGSFLESKPRNLTSSEFMSYMTAAELIERIKNGVKNSSMPAWKNVLTEEQLVNIVDYIDQAFFPLSKSHTDQDK